MKHAARRRLWILVAAVALYTVVGFFVLPPIVRSQIEKRLYAELGRRVSVEKVRLNPYTLSLTLQGFSVREPDGTAPFVGWQRLYVNFDALGSLRHEWVLSEVVLDGLAGHVAVNAQGGFNFSDIITKLQAAHSASPSPEPSRPVRIGRCRVTGARLEFSDDSRGGHFATTVGPIAFAVTDFRTVSRQGSPYAFEAVTESGEKLAWGGTLQAQPMRSSGEFLVENLRLPKYAPYYSDRLQAELVAGLLTVRGHYDLDLTPGQPRVVKLTDGGLQLRDLRVRERGADVDAIALPALDVTGAQADLEAQKASVATVRIAGGHLRLRREKDGSINVLTMLRPPNAGPSPAAPAAPAPASPFPDVTLDDFSVKDMGIEVTDLAAPRPAQLALEGLQVGLQHATLKEGAEFPMQLAFGWAPHGTVRLDGSVGLRPIKAALKADVAAFEILPLSPYLEEFVNAQITQGTVTASLSVDAALPEGGALAATVAGTAAVEKFGLVDGVHHDQLVGFGSLALHGIKLSTAPALAVVLESVEVASPYARIIVNPDKTLNLALVAKAPATSTTPAAEGKPENTAAAPVAPGNGPQVEIGKITILDADYRFVDRSVEPNVSMAVSAFGGTITGLSSTNPAKADVDLKAAVDGAGPVAITGKLDPLGAQPSVNLVVDARNVDLTPLSPYSGKYAGYELARGKMMLAVKLVVDGKKIDSNNVVTLNQFTLGNPVESPEATKLPVRLGVALLKDTNGNIVIDLPVQGRIDDPSFKIGHVVMRVIVNLLTKAAVSPFSLLGAAFGGGGEELGFQEFVPGTAELRSEEKGKLDTLVKALTNRPALSVDIEGSFDAGADAFALKRTKFDASVRRAIWEKKHLADPNIPPPDQLTIAPEETGAMVKQLYDEKFPPGTEFGAPVAAAPKVVAPPPAPKKGIVKRAVAVVTFRHLREKRAAEREAKRQAAEEHQAAAAAAAATGLPVEEMSSRLAETVTVDANDLRGLAEHRARQVRDYFTEIGKISGDRLFLSKDQTAAAKDGKGPRVFLHLQ